MKPYRRVSSSETSEEPKAEVIGNNRDSTTAKQTSVTYQTLKKISQQKPLPLSASADHRSLPQLADRHLQSTLHVAEERRTTGRRSLFIQVFRVSAPLLDLDGARSRQSNF